MKVVLCTIFVVITLNHLLGKWSAIAMLELKQVSYESGTLHNLCSYNLEPNSKDNSEYAVLCSLLQALTRGREAAEQDFCEYILGAKQHLCWGGGRGRG